MKLLPILLIASLHGTAQSDTVFYNYVSSGKIVGRQWLLQKGKNDYYYYDEYNDRGRGPAINSHLRTDERGAVITAEYKGHDYYKSPVDETFRVRNGQAAWKNKFENDSAAFKRQIYSDINGPTAEYALIYKMLLDAGGQIAVLPAGTRNCKKLTTNTIPGIAKPLQLVSFSGYGGAPIYLWFTSEGKFFASVSDWFSLIQKGHESQTDQLYAIQKKYESSFLTDLADRLSDKPSSGLAITNTTVFDPSTGTTQKDQTVLIKDDRIIKLGPAANTSVPTGFKTIDGKGKFLMPGLWEMHGHFGKSDGPFMLAQGVTNLRDMGNGPELLQIRESIRKDSILGPDITVISGFIDKAGPFAAPTGDLINSLEEGLRSVDKFHEKGYDQIKIYSSIEPAWVKPMAEKAHGYGMRVCGHIPAYMTASQAIDAGYDEITHVNMLVLNFFGDTVDTRSMGRFFLPGRKGYTLDLHGDSVQAFIRKLQEHHTVLDPTLGIFQEMFTELPGHISGKYAPIAAYLPPEIKRGAMNGGYLDKDSLIDTYKRSFAFMKALIRECYDKGLIILSGTDGGILQHDLEVYSECGIPNADVLKMATYWPAKVYHKDDILGTVAENKIANLILIDGDPLQNMGDIRKIYCTVRSGNVYWPKEIYKAFGWKYYY